MELFDSVLGQTIAEYVWLKQALGRTYDGERRVLASLDAFLAAEDSDLTADTFARWCQTQEHLTSGVRRYRMRVVRNLALYRRRREPSCFVPDPFLFPLPHHPVQPYIFTHSEIAGLIQQADALAASRDCPLRPELFSLAITLLYTAGLRRGELLRMTSGDYNPREGTLLVRKSKFHKSRVLPLSAEGIKRLDCYLYARRAHRLSVSPEIPLMWNTRGGGRAYTAFGFADLVHRLFDAVGVRKPDGHRPRIHDFRHTFAVHALLRWYHAGEDVQAKLPLLATYMGHVSIVSTQYYLKLTESLASSASERFASRYASLIVPLPIPIPGDAQ
ncbi:MAG: tyrosine-type recombinase/integrase [Chloroflexi bacterium]|nr:tyrosine-type recombinase/integrase [Chloroflexota bacterium]